MKMNLAFSLGLYRMHPRCGNKLFLFPCIFLSLLLMSGCSALQNESSYNLDKQIERQQIQHDLMSSDQDEQDNRTATEFEELGDRYLVRGDINRAYIYYIKGLGVEPDNVSLAHKQGALLLKKKKFIEAETVYEKLLSVDRQDTVALEGCGKALFGQGKLIEAESFFLAALERKPDQWQSHEFLGLLYSRQQKYDQAKEHFKKALSSQPRNVSVNNNLAVTFYLSGNFGEAVRLFKGLTTISNKPIIHNNLALAYFRIGRFDEALESFKRGTDTEAMAYNLMGYEFLIDKKYDQAVEAFERAIELYPKFYPSAQKNLDVARHELSKAVAAAEQ